MAFGGNRDHRHQHRPLATMEPPQKQQRSRRQLSPGGSAGHSHQPAPRSPTSLHSTSFSSLPFLRHTLAHRSGAQRVSLYSHRVCCDTSQLPSLSAMQRWNLHFYIHLNSRKKDKAEQPKRVGNNHKLNDLSPKLYSSRLCPVQYG